MVTRLIMPEIAERYGRPLATVRKNWAKHPAWPPPAGKRGQYNEYDADAVDAAVQAITTRPPLADDGDPDELLDVNAAAGYAGLDPSTVYSDISRGRWPEPDDTAHGVSRWKRSTIAAEIGGRRPYQRKSGSSETAR